MLPADGAPGHRLMGAILFRSPLLYFGETKNKALSVAPVKHIRRYSKKSTICAEKYAYVLLAHVHNGTQ